MSTLFKIKCSPFYNDPRIECLTETVFEYSRMDEKKYQKVRGFLIFIAHWYPFCQDIKRYANIVKYWFLLTILDDHTECEWGDIA